MIKANSDTVFSTPLNLRVSVSPSVHRFKYKHQCQKFIHGLNFVKRFSNIMLLDTSPSNFLLIAVLSVLALRDLVEVYLRFRDPCFIHYQGYHYDGDSKDFLNVEDDNLNFRQTRRFCM